MNNIAFIRHFWACRTNEAKNVWHQQPGFPDVTSRWSCHSTPFVKKFYRPMMTFALTSFECIINKVNRVIELLFPWSIKVRYGNLLLCPVRIKVRPFELLSGVHQGALYCNWLSRLSFAYQNTEQSGVPQRVDQMVIPFLFFCFFVFNRGGI